MKGNIWVVAHVSHLAIGHIVGIQSTTHVTNAITMYLIMVPIIIIIIPITQLAQHMDQ